MPKYSLLLLKKSKADVTAIHKNQLLRQER